MRRKTARTPYIIVYTNGYDTHEIRSTAMAESESEARRNFNAYASPRTKIVDIYESAKGPHERAPLDKVSERLNGLDKEVRLGYEYMIGRKSVADIKTYVNSKHYSSETQRKIARGAELAEEDGRALKSRVQPEQDSNTVQASYAGRAGKYRTKAPPKSGKLAANPNYVSYAAQYKQSKLVAAPPKTARPTSGGKRVLSTYDVAALNKQRQKIKEEKATGSKQIRPTKSSIRSTLHVKRQKFDIYNVSKHRTVKD